MPGIEPGTFRPQTGCSTKLSYTLKRWTRAGSLTYQPVDGIEPSSICHPGSLVHQIETEWFAWRQRPSRLPSWSLPLSSRIQQHTPHSVNWPPGTRTQNHRINRPVLYHWARGQSQNVNVDSLSQPKSSQSLHLTKRWRCRLLDQECYFLCCSCSPSLTWMVSMFKEIFIAFTKLSLDPESPFSFLRTSEEYGPGWISERFDCMFSLSLSINRLPG